MTTSPATPGAAFEEAARLAVDALYDEGLDPVPAILGHGDPMVRALALQLVRTIARAGLILASSRGDDADELVADAVRLAGDQWIAARQRCEDAA
ncbi:MAG: hypothetical protein OEY23_14345 [Acidimicrobiia bacterium]|nr:hypothetical protein [Acidimicrobiia bacterium]